MHLEMCQSPMLTAKATTGQRSAPRRHRLDVTQLKINVSCQDEDYSFKICESHAVRNQPRQGPAPVALWDME